MSRIEEEVALVTGGTRGIGLAITQALLERAARVFVCATGQAGLDQALESLRKAHPNRIDGAVCDVRRHEQVVRMFQRVESRFGGLDILVNNAGIGAFES